MNVILTSITCIQSRNKLKTKAISLGPKLITNNCTQQTKHSTDLTFKQIKPETTD